MKLGERGWKKMREFVRKKCGEVYNGTYLTVTSAKLQVEVVVIRAVILKSGE
jgi:hypothetical protein